MANALRVFRRDARRILQVPKVWAIVLGLVIMPSMYAWVNILAFWDPYSDTEHVKVAVVNLDEGASSEMTGELNVGDQIVEAIMLHQQLSRSAARLAARKLLEKVRRPAHLQQGPAEHHHGDLRPPGARLLRQREGERDRSEDHRRRSVDPRFSGEQHVRLHRGEDHRRGPREGRRRHGEIGRAHV